MFKLVEDKEAAFWNQQNSMYTRAKSTITIHCSGFILLHTCQIASSFDSTIWIFFFGNKNHLKNCNHFKQRIRTHFDCPAATVNLHRGSRDSNIPLILIKWTNNPFILRERIYINEYVTWVDIISLALAKVAIPDSSDRRLSKGALAELKHHDFCTFI